jgi:hypothetical protein
MIPNFFMVLVPRMRSYYGLLFSSYSMISGSTKYLLLLEYSKKFSSIPALPLAWNIPFEVSHDCGTSLFQRGKQHGFVFVNKDEVGVRT